MYREGGIENLLVWEYHGRASSLSRVQKEELETHLEVHCSEKAEEVIAYVQEIYGITYTRDGITKVMRELGFAYKKFSSVPAGADPEKQRAFIEMYEERKKNKGEDEVILFSDATHPNSETKLGRGWTKVGKRKEVRTNSGRQRINLLRAINLEDLSYPLMKTYDTIDKHSIIDFIGLLEKKYPDKKKITFICDNSRYFHAKDVQIRLRGSPVEFLFLPAYSPNLNPIERFWKFFFRYGLQGRYFHNIKCFRSACFEFFDLLPSCQNILDSWITDNFSPLDPLSAHFKS